MHFLLAKIVNFELLFNPHRARTLFVFACVALAGMMLTLTPVQAQDKPNIFGTLGKFLKQGNETNQTPGTTANTSIKEETNGARTVSAGSAPSSGINVGNTGTLRLALVIGNDAYTSVTPLKNARNDATLMAVTLKNAGFDVTQLGNLNRQSMFDALDIFKGRIHSGDEVVFYFAGHGVQISSNQLILPTDITAKTDQQVQRDGVSLVDVQDSLKAARFALLVIDACRDNPFPKVGTRAIGDGTRGLMPPEPATGQAIIMSAGRNQTALDGVPGQSQSNGLFTWQLAQVLQTPGLEIRQALEEVKNKVDDTAKVVGHEQRPSFVNDLRGNFYFFSPAVVPAQQTTVATVAVAQAKSKEKIEDEFWDSIKGTNEAANFALYLKTYPTGRYVGLAQLAVNKLKVVAVPTPAASTPSISQPVQAAKGIKDCAICPEMVVVPAGSFMMGGSESANQQPVHKVTIQGFAIGKYPVTQGEWQSVMGGNPSRNNQCGPTCPVEKVSWFDAHEFIQKLNSITGKSYRLPSEAEWEYACRAGGNHKYCGTDNLEALTWHSINNSPNSTHPIASKQENAFGLYDMNGNVWQWVEDWYQGNYTGSPDDGSARTNGAEQKYRVQRGGSYGSGDSRWRSTYRGSRDPSNREVDNGFRLAKTLANP